jgi:lipoprotein-releasing system permease protein
MPWYVYLALKQLFSTGQRIFFTAISIASVALGVALMLIVLSVMGGFSSKIRQMTQDTRGDVEIRAAVPIPDPNDVQAVIRRVPGVVATSPFTEGYVMVQFQNRPAFPAMEGIDLSAVGKVAPIGRYIVAGSLNNLDDDSIILSSRLAQEIGAWIGSKVEVYSPAILQRLKANEILLPKELTVVGIFEYGHQQLDSSTVIVTLREMQDLYDLGRAVDGIDVRLSEGADADAAATRIDGALQRAEGRELPVLPGLAARSWREMNQNFLWAIQMERNIMTIILLIVIVVAAFLTMSLLVVLVLKKTREIGLLAALGARRLQVALSFCLQGVAIGLVGTAAGLALGFTLLHFRNDVVNLVTRLTGGQQAFANIYEFSQLPSHTSQSELTIIVVGALILSTLAGVIPAWLAASLKPAEALRNE